MVARLPHWLTAMALSGAVLAAGQVGAPLTFDQVPAGSLPPGFSIESLRQKDPGRWEIVRLGTNPVLRHTAAEGAGGWSLAVTGDAAPAQFRFTARVRLQSGRHAGGLVWHYRDPRNFMAALLDLDQGEIELFRVADGNRVRLEDRDGLDLDDEAWHTLRVTCDEGKTTVSIGGIRVLDQNDRRSGPTGLRVGVVAHGSADIAFDDLRLEPLQVHRGR